MEVQLQELIEKVKNEGIRHGQEEARKIIEEAEKKAASLGKEARRQAEQIRQEAQKDAARLKQEAEDSIRIALRDLTLKFKNRIQELFDGVILKEVKEQMSPDLLQRVITDLLGRWKEDGGEGIQLKLSPPDHDQLAGYFQSRLSSRFKEGITVKPQADIDRGFVVSLRDGSVNYDFTAETISEIIADDMEPAIRELLKEANTGG